MWWGTLYSPRPLAFSHQLSKLYLTIIAHVLQRPAVVAIFPSVNLHRQTTSDTFLGLVIRVPPTFSIIASKKTISISQNATYSLP